MKRLIDLYQVTKVKRTLSALIIFLIIYVLSYIIFRIQLTETWVNDGNNYVIFPENQRWVYYLFRPLTYVDGVLTDMRFHIGPHH